MLFPLCLSDVYPAHMFPQTGMHTHKRTHTHAQENTDMKGGAFWQADQGQQGLFDQ